MRFPRMKHVGAGRFMEKQMPRCKCELPEGKPGGLCKSCKLAVLTYAEKLDYRAAYPTSAYQIDGDFTQTRPEAPGLAKAQTPTRAAEN